MDLDNQAAESGLDSGNAGGEMRTVEAPRSQGISLKDSIAKAASSVRERAPLNGSAKPQAGEENTAFETSETLARALSPDAGTQEEVAPSIPEAPKHWPQKRRDAFGRFVAEKPDLAKEWLEHTKELEGEFTRKSQEHAEHRKFADTVRELFAPEQRALLQQTGANEIQAIQWWSKLDQFSRQDPAGYAKWFMQQAGLTPQQLFPEIGQVQAQQPAEQEWVDPEIIKLREELGSLRSQQQQYQAWIQQQEHARMAQSQQATQTLIQEFSSSVDEAGTPLYPHFETLKHEMAYEMNKPDLARMPDSLEKLKLAYDRAVYANPQTRQEMLERQQAAQQAELAKRQAAEKARAAQTLKPKINSAAGAGKVPPSDLKSLIRDAASRARG